MKKLIYLPLVTLLLSACETDELFPECDNRIDTVYVEDSVIVEHHTTASDYPVYECVISTGSFYDEEQPDNTLNRIHYSISDTTTVYLKIDDNYVSLISTEGNKLSHGQITESINDSITYNAYLSGGGSLSADSDSISFWIRSAYARSGTCHSLDYDTTIYTVITDTVYQ